MSLLWYVGRKWKSKTVTGYVDYEGNFFVSTVLKAVKFAKKKTNKKLFLCFFFLIFQIENKCSSSFYGLSEALVSVPKVRELKKVREYRSPREMERRR